MSEADLEHRLFGSSLAANYARPDYGRIHQELRRKGVTVGVDLFSMTGVAVWIRALAWGSQRRSLIPLGFQSASLPRIVGVPIYGHERCKAGTPPTWV
jgi:hypothetical protein